MECVHSQVVKTCVSSEHMSKGRGVMSLRLGRNHKVSNWKSVLSGGTRIRIRTFIILNIYQ